uniref:Neur_chan_LBD domain-containing protein n=1 Tax=Mesocestoides corti TaxID=53468 RepID=A0A5K3EFY0_MESCO
SREEKTCALNKGSNDQPRRQVYLCVIFLKIGEIDTIKEQYAADVLIKAKWRETEMDAAETVEYDWMKSWSPKLYIENTIGETREQLHRIITFNEFGHAFLVEKRRVSGVFLENLELNHFPFDVQDLTITIASNLPSSEIRLVNDPDEPHRINKQSFVDEQEWYLYKHIETEQHELANEYEEHASAHPTLSVKCRAARRPAYFIWNIFLVTACKRRRLMCAKDIKYLERIKCQMKKKGIRQHRTLDQST